ncbi:MAG TPA: PAS domain-containing sensor histidine kinase, partial [Candidatus Angelobacter sp.]|nr:PAS domain-containing sensor histidine kinase [Candidatus Angelobacter sp.]
MGKTPESGSPRAYQLFSAIAAGTAIVAGITVMAGWWLHITGLTSILPGLATMKPNTAICFVLSGAALWLQRAEFAGGWRAGRAAKTAARICAAIVVALGAANLCERLFGWDLGVDELVFRRTLLATNVPNPGLMAAATAMAFTLIGAALLVLDWETRQKRRPAQGLALIAALTGAIAVLGYVYGVRVFSVSVYASMALHTAILFVAMGAAVLFARPNRGMMAVLTNNGLGGLVARRLLPILIVLPVIAGWIRLKGQQYGYYGTEFGLAIFTASNVVISVVVLWVTALWLNRTD